jgi:hypothetical protein
MNLRTQFVSEKLNDVLVLMKMNKEYITVEPLFKNQ